MRENFYRHFGVYGICEQNEKILVVKKKSGPYQNRFDIPGDRLDDGEPLLKGMKRAFFEETGYAIVIEKQIGVCDYMLPWRWKHVTHLHHIALFYEVHLTRGGFIDPYEKAEDNITNIEWIGRSDVNNKNVSPLVMTAFDYMEKNQIGMKLKRFSKWEITNH